MDIKDFQRERDVTKEEIRKAMQAIVEGFAKKTGVPITSILIFTEHKSTQSDELEIWVDNVVVEVDL